MSAHQDASLVTDTGLPAKAPHFDSGVIAKAGFALFIFSTLAIFAILVLTAGNAIAAPRHNADNTAEHRNHSIKLYIDSDDDDTFKQAMSHWQFFQEEHLPAKSLANLIHSSKTFSEIQHAIPHQWNRPVSIDVRFHDKYAGIPIHTLSPQPQITLPAASRVPVAALPDFAAPVVSAIPEPSTYLMLIVGFAVCMLVSRQLHG